MNSCQRKEIRKLIDQLEEIKDAVEVFMSEEQDKIDNIPENLQMSEKADNMQETYSNLEEAESLLEEVVFALENSINV